MATIIIRNSTGSGVIPSSLQQGELAINTKDGKLFYGSGSGNIVKEFTGSGGGGSTFPYTGSARITGSLDVIGNTTITGSVFISSSNATQLLVGTSSLFVNSSGNVGIGTTSPSHLLSLGAGSIAMVDSYPIRWGTSNLLYGSTTGLDIASSAFAVRFRFTVGGNLLIGTTTDSARLTVKGSGATSATTALRVENTNASASLVVRDDGSVGIGTATPSVSLEVVGNMIISGSITQRGGGGVVFYDNTGNGGGKINGGYGYLNGEVYIAPSSGLANNFIFSPNNGMSIGGFTIGGTAGSPPAYGLAVSGSIGVGTRVPAAQLHISASNSSSAYSFLVQNSAGNTLIGVQNDRTVNINSTNATNGNTTIGTTSGTITFNQGYNNTFVGNALTFYNGGVASTIQGFTTNPGIAVGYAQSNANPNTGSVFTVKGTAASSGSGVLFVTGSSTTRLLRISSETDSSILVVSGSGNVGIGINSPSKKLHLNVSSSDDGFILTKSGSANSIFRVTMDGTNDRGEMFLNNGATAIFAVRQSSNVSYINTGNNFGVGTTSPTAQLQVKGSGATSATTSFLVQNSTPTNIITVLDNGTVGILRAPTSSLDVAGTTRLSGSFNTAASGSILTVIGSGSTQPIFTVQGSQGELFSITDSLSGSLFSVNDISGLPILEVFSDNTTLIGDYQDPMLITTKKVTMTNSGSFVVYSLLTASYDTAFFDYSIKSGSNGRAGQIMAIQSGSSVNFTETTTTDFGDTSAVTFTVQVSGSYMILSGLATAGSWTIKTIVRGI